MDLFRAQDAASKTILAAHTAGVLAKTVDGFENFLSRLGVNNDNALSAGTYDFNLVTRNRILLEAAYRGSWIVGRVVDSVAEDMTRAGIDISTNEAEEDIKDFQAYISRMQTWQSVAALVRWGRLYGGAIAVIQIEGQALDTPLDLDTVAQKQYKGLVIYDRWQLNPVMTPVIDSGPDMGLPKYYEITTSVTSMDPTSPSATGQMRVHHSRCIRFTGIDLPYFQAITEMMWGESVLERMWDRLISFDNATMSAASLIDRASLRTVSIEGFREVVAAGGEAMTGLLAQFEMMRLMQVNEGLTLLDKNDDFKSTAYSFAGLPDTLLQFGQQLSGASEIPLVRLFGQSPAGLNSTGDGDIRMYYDTINAKQESKLRNPFEILLRVMWRSCYGKPAPKDLEFSFTSLWQMSALDKATVAKTNTETALGAHEAGLISQSTAMKELRGLSSDTGLFSNISDKELAEADEELPPEPDLPGEGDEPGAGGEDGGDVVDDGADPVKALDAKGGRFIDRFYRWFTGDGKDFKESDHPREDDGKFGSGGGGGKKKSGTTKSREEQAEAKAKAERIAKNRVIASELARKDNEARADKERSDPSKKSGGVYEEIRKQNLNKGSGEYKIQKPKNAETDAEREVVLPDGSTEEFSSEAHAKKYVEYLERKKGPLPESKTERASDRIREAGQDLTIRGVRKQDVYSSLQKTQIGDKHYEIPQTYVWFHDDSGDLVDKVGGERDDDNSEFASEDSEKELKQRLSVWMKREGLDDEFEASVKLGEKRGFAVVLRPKDRAPYEVKKKK